MCETEIMMFVDLYNICDMKQKFSIVQRNLYREQDVLSFYRQLK